MAELTPATVVNTLAQIGKDIDAATEKLKEADWAEREAYRIYRRAEAVSLLSNKCDANGKPYTVQEKEAMALLATEEESLAWGKAAYNLQVVKDELKALRDRLEIGRSMSPIMRLEWGAKD